MNRWLRLGLLISSFLPLPTHAQSPFDGTWKVDLAESQSQSRPEVYLLENGTYRCRTCDPPIAIRADGRDHKITGEPCYDTVSITVDDRTVRETDKRQAKIVGTSTMTVSPDGNSATVNWSESCSASGDTVTGNDIMTRLAGGPAGSHPISGTWRISKRLNRSENALVITLKLDDHTFTFTDPTGQGYTAKLDGTETPIAGDLSHTIVSAKRTSQDTVQVTNKHNGKIDEIDEFKISPDGKTLTVSLENRSTQNTRQFVLHKQ